MATILISGFLYMSMFKTPDGDKKNVNQEKTKAPTCTRCKSDSHTVAACIRPRTPSEGPARR
jgi:hypothetical protein